ncbi:MAG: hypothetical protein ISS50_03565 [Anaerolineae bacterium]|nr:hypothetical protein [Anaerolineae bacterium]
MQRRPKEVSRWEKMPLWGKLILVSLFLIPLSCCGSIYFRQTFGEAIERQNWIQDLSEGAIPFWAGALRKGSSEGLVSTLARWEEGGGFHLSDPFSTWPRRYQGECKAFHAFVNGLRSEKSRTDLMGKLHQHKIEYRADYTGDLQKLCDWAREHGYANNMDLSNLREYFQEELGWSDKDWQLFEQFYHQGKSGDLGVNIPIHPDLLSLVVFLLILATGYGLVRWSHYGAKPTPAPKLEKGVEFLLSSRAEYLGGHPLLSEIQVVRLGLTEEEVVIAAKAGTATIPVRDISEAIVGSERSPSMIATLGTTTVSLLPRRYLVIQYVDETGMTNNVIFGYIAPPHSHEEWRNKIVSTRYRTITSKSLGT